MVDDKIVPQEVERFRDQLEPVVERFTRNRNPVLAKALDDTIDRGRAGR